MPEGIDDVARRNRECTNEREGTMSEKPLVMTVEDDPSMRDIIATALEGDYRVAGALGGEEALRAARALRPQAILLDVEMPPGIDGYEVCRRLKQDEATAEIPVVFVSARDNIENRLLGYEAGGEDYIVKPFDVLELEAKLAHLLKAVAERAGLKEMANYASSTAMTAMTSMSEMGALLQAMKSFGACADGRGLAEAALAGLAPYGLTGALQVRGAEGTLTRDARGEASPLEASVITQMAAMERIVQFKSRMAISYRRVSLLVHDMPVEDAERCGRLRDHLAMLVEAADARAEAIAAAEESRRRGATIERAVSRITTALADIDRAQRQNQVATRLAVESVTQQMETAYVSVALSPAQEDYMAGILRQGIDRLLNTQTGVFGLQNQLSSIVHELKGMSASPP